MNFASDNTAPIAPGVFEAILRANSGFALGYGNDALTRAMEQRFAQVFDREVAVFPVATGTAANALALAHVTAPGQAVLCHADAHIMTDECAAPEFFGGGLKLIGLAGDAGKLSVETVRVALKRYTGHRPHQAPPAALSLSQVTEVGTIYTIDELRALADVAHAHGLAVHMDGARFANALVALRVSPAEMSWKAGIDVLSFGATKGGALAAEAVVFFDPTRAATMAERRKRGGHLWSKHRFLAAQFEGFFANDYWLALAAHANRMARRLADGLAARCRVLWPVEANLIFVVLPAEIDKRLRAAGASYHLRQNADLPAGATLQEGEVLARLVTSFATTQEEVDRFVMLATA